MKLEIDFSKMFLKLKTFKLTTLFLIGSWFSIWFGIYLLASFPTFLIACGLGNFIATVLVRDAYNL